MSSFIPAHALEMQGELKTAPVDDICVSWSSPVDQILKTEVLSSSLFLNSNF